MPELQLALRYVVFAAFAASALVALASWLVRTRRISPFGALGRTLRSASDPLIRPVEARLVPAGGNPAHAGWWLVVAVAAARWAAVGGRGRVLAPVVVGWWRRAGGTGDHAPGGPTGPGGTATPSRRLVARALLRRDQEGDER